MKQQMRPNNAEITSFILVLADRNLHMSQTAWPTNSTSNNAHASVFLFFRYSTQKTHLLVSNFEVGHFTRHLFFFFLFVFFLLVLLWKEFNSHSFTVTFHFSRSYGSPPVFYPAVDSCWIHINVSCSTCIYSMPLISLNDEPRLVHRRQQSAGSAFQFHNSMQMNK